VKHFAGFVDEREGRAEESEGCAEAARGEGRGREREERVGWEDNSIPVN